MKKTSSVTNTVLEKVRKKEEKVQSEEIKSRVMISVLLSGGRQEKKRKEKVPYGAMRHEKF